MEQIIKTLILLGAVVLGVWGIEARYAAASSVVDIAISVKEVQKVIRSQQESIKANQTFFLEYMKDTLEIEQFMLEQFMLEHNEMEEFQYKQNASRLETLQRQLDFLDYNNN